MNKRIYITYADDVSPQQALKAVRMAMHWNIAPAYPYTLRGPGLGVELKGGTKHPCYYVWRLPK